LAVLVLFGFVVVGIVEMRLWPKRPLKKVLVYWIFLAAAALLSALMVVNIDLPVPSPLDFLNRLAKEIWQGWLVD